MISLNEVPFLRVSCFFTAGIIAGAYQSFEPVYGMIALVLLFCGARFLPGLFKSSLLWLALIISGAIFHQVESSGKILPPAGGTSLLVRLEKSTGKFYRAARYYDIEGQQTGKIMVGGPYVKDIPEGSLLYTEESIRDFTPASYPSGFDPVKFYKSQGFSGQLQLKEQNTLAAGSKPRPPDIWERMQEWVLAQTAGAGFTQAQRAIIEATLLGYKTNLDAETRDAFIGSGTMHVLAVSGMHVGIIYILVSFLLPWKTTSLVPRLLKSAVIFIILWGYCFLTGATASVLRATIMFSAFQLAAVFKLPSHPLNTLSVTAFGMLVVAPSLLWDIGFQLSFLAVSGILVFYAPLLRLWSPRYKVLKYIWSMIAVSLAAQLTTLPVSLYHFGQFPLYFLPANLVAVPVSGILLPASLLWLVLSPVPYIGPFLAYMAGYTAEGLLVSMDFMAGLPGATLKNLYISAIGVISLYFIIYLLFSGAYQYKPRQIIAGLAISCFVMLFNLFQPDSYHLYIGYAYQKPALGTGKHEKSVFPLQDFHWEQLRFRYPPDRTVMPCTYQVQEYLIQVHPAPIQVDSNAIIVISASYLQTDSLLSTIRKTQTLVACGYFSVPVKEKLEALREEGYRVWLTAENGYYTAPLR